MIKKSLCLLLIMLLTLSLFGCWNYRGLNQMAAVVGIAVDKNPAGDVYELTFEVVDLAASSKEKGPSAKIIESEGKTIFEAVRNAKRKMANKLYFGEAQVVVISEDIARSEDLGAIIDWFMRDGECRETMCLIISQEETARAILSIEGIDKAIVSTELRAIIKSDKKVTASTAYVEMYEAFSALNAKGKSLALPAFHNVINDGEPASELNGIAVFKGERLVGYLTPEESKYYLFIVNEMQGGVLALSAGGQEDDATLEISRNTTKRSYAYQDGKLKVTIKTDTVVYLGELMVPGNALDKELIAALEDAAETQLEQKIMEVVRKVQFEYDSDIFGFGNMVYKRDPRLWNQLGDTWNEQFQSMEVEVYSDIHIVNTASVEKR
jgi:spore germination protein KC